MKPATKRLSRLRVEPVRRVDLQQLPVAHHRDALAERHRLDLVVRDVDGRRAETVVELRERRAHADAELGVEVRERLVEQERLRLAGDRAAHRDPLALAARELRRPAVEQLREAEQRGDLVDPPRDLGLRRPRAPSGRSRCSGARSCAGRARSVWKTIAMSRSFGARSVTSRVADRDRARGDVLEPRDHAQERRLAAAGRPDQRRGTRRPRSRARRRRRPRRRREGLAHVLEEDAGHRR